MKNKVIIFIPSIEDGGVEKNLFLISNYLSNYFKKLSIITTTPKQKKKFSSKINFISYKFNILENFNRRLKYILCFILLILEIFKDKKIVILSFQANIYCIILSKIFGLKVIIRSNSAPIGWSKNFIKKKIYKFIIKKADKIIVNSKEFKNEMRKYFNVNTTCIYNPLNYSEIIKKSKEKIKEKIFDKRTFNLINIGRIVDQKDQLLILKAIKELKLNNYKFNLKLFIIGKGELESKLHLFAKKNNIQKYIKFLGYKKNPYPYIKKSDVFILSSKFEGLPNVLLEAQSLKVPIISSNCKTGPKEILNNGELGLIFKVGNYKQLANHIITYYKNNALRMKHSNLGYKKIKRFDFDKNLKNYLKLIKKVSY